MSLKAFHVVFITCSILFSLGFGVWGVRNFMETGNVVNLLMGIGTFIGAIALVWYGMWFLRKFKKLGWL